MPSDVITVLYRKEQAQSPNRLDAAVQAATLALEDEFARRSFRVVQPSAQIYQVLDQGPAVVVSFAPDAGFSLVFSAFRSQRPMAGMDKQMTEVLLRARVFVGHSILVAEESRGMMAATSTADVKEFADQRGAEQAAKRAAAALADKVARRLKALSAADLDRLTSLAPAMAQASTAPLPADAPQPAPAAAPTAAAPPAAAALPPIRRRFALVVAVSNYDAVRQRLGPKAMDDLPGVKIDRVNLLAALKKQGFKEDDIVDLADAKATSAAVRDALGKWVATTKPEDLVLIAFAAHGAAASFGPTGFGMPVLADFNGVGGGDNLDFWQLQSMVANLPARRAVLLVDTCHSGGVTGNMVNVVVSSRGTRLQTGSTVSPEPERMAQAGLGGRAFAIIAASRPEQLSWEGTDGTGGLFTSAVVKAMSVQPGQLPLGDLFKKHIEPQVIAASTAQCRNPQNCKQLQTPMFAFAGGGDQIRL